MNQYAFQLQISPDQYLDYYRGAVKKVLVRCRNGQTLQFPASFLQRFVTHEGIQGSFVLLCDDSHKCVELKRVS